LHTIRSAGGVIPAQKSPLFFRWFAWTAQRRIERAFGAMHVHGLSELADTASAAPVLVVSNHTSWWDALTVLACVRRVGVDAYSMMDSGSLRALPFFSLVGAFGVERDDARDGARAIRHTAALLDGPRRLVWIFPQGRERPVTARPLGFRGGTGQIARLSPQARTIPAAIRYEYGGEERAAVYVSFGTPVARQPHASGSTAAHESAVVAEMDRIDRALVSGDLSEFDCVHRTRTPRAFAWAQWALARLVRLRALR
jgi:1-acyl-sn-glycerol-3-phosphate acyltransferase